MKKLLSLLCVVLSALMAHAQFPTAHLNFTASPAQLVMRPSGNTQFTVDVSMNNDLPVMGLMFDVKLPKGFKLVSGKSSSRCGIFQRTNVSSLDGYGRVVIVGMGDSSISGTEGTITTLTFEVSPEAADNVLPILYSESFSLHYYDIFCSCRYKANSNITRDYEARAFYGSVSVDASALDIYPLGDLDKSKDVTANDAAIAARALAADDELIKARKEADVNWDGQFSISDITALIQKLQK